MTDHVRTSYRRHRKATWTFLLVALAAGALAAVLPALGAVGDQIPPAERGRCNPDPRQRRRVELQLRQRHWWSRPRGSVDLPDHESSLIPGPRHLQPFSAGVTLTLRGLNGKFFAFQVTGASMFHVGVKGGTDHAWYNYAPGGRTHDGAAVAGGVPTTSTGLHATLKNANTLHSASITTFCYARVTTISGRVFLDNDGNGSFTSSTPPDAGQNGWTVKLFNTSTGGPPVSLTTPSPGTDPAGSYTFTGVPIGSNYKVCVEPPDDSVVWDQTVPTENTACSDVTDALPIGQVITNLQSAATGKDFGVQPTIGADCIEEFGPEALEGSQIVEYKAQLTNPGGGSDCKDAVVMYSYLDGSDPYAVIRPTANADPDDVYWVVERLRMNVPGVPVGAQNPVELEYDDDEPYGDVYGTMKMCLKDPRVSNDDFALAEDPSLPAVMPSDETSCMIQSTDFPSGNTYNYEAYIASAVDGIKTPT